MNKAKKKMIEKTIAAVFAAMVLTVDAFECSEAVKAKTRNFIENEKQFHLGFCRRPTISKSRTSTIRVALKDTAFWWIRRSSTMRTGIFFSTARCAILG